MFPRSVISDWKRQSELVGQRWLHLLLFECPSRFGVERVGEERWKEAAEDERLFSALREHSDVKLRAADYASIERKTFIWFFLRFFPLGNFFRLSTAGTSAPFAGYSVNATNCK